MKVLLLCWRDTGHPEGGGSERYLEEVAFHLAQHGHQVVFATARYPESARTEYIRRDGQHGAGVWFSRAGGNLTVYLRAGASMLAARLADRLRHCRTTFSAKLLSLLERDPVAAMGVPDVVAQNNQKSN